MRVENVAIQTPVSITPSFTTPKIELTHAGFVAVQAVATGTAPTGTLTVLGSCDGVNFGTVSGVSPLSVSAVGTSILNLGDVGYKFIQLSWAFTSGTGTIALTVNAKGF
jgi:hypothetical protein